MNAPVTDETPEIDRFSTGMVHKILRVSKKTLERWDKGKRKFLPAQRTKYGARYYTRDQIEAFMLSTYVIRRSDGFLEYRPLGGGSAEPAEGDDHD